MLFKGITPWSELLAAKAVKELENRNKVQQKTTVKKRSGRQLIFGKPKNFIILSFPEFIFVLD
jgi:hypothetical protein